MSLESIKPFNFLYQETKDMRTPSAQAASESNRPFDQIVAELEECQFEISPRQFAHRLVPAYLDKTAIVGIHSLNSVRHWIDLISLWIEGKGLFLSHKISKKDLGHLLTILKDYERTLARYNTTSHRECRESAKTTLQEVQTGLNHSKIFYTPLGYASSVNGGGHAIPLKLQHRGKQIEAIFLNLGEGLQMHPQVDWSSSGPRYHFQSFPVLIDKEMLASSQCEDVFTRLVHLMVDQGPPEARSYSAEDVYGPIYSLGTIQSSFSTTIADRARKPQLGDICGGMASLLIVKDLLIDLRYTKNELQRLLCLEKLCDILFFYRHLKRAGGSKDEWLLLKNGLQEFSIRGLKAGKEVISEEEVGFLHDLLHPIFSHATQQIRQLQKTRISITDLQNGSNPSSNSFKTEALDAP